MHPRGLNSGEFEWWTVLATGLATPNRGFVWQLHDEVVTGLIACGHSAAGSLLSIEKATPAPKYWTAHWQNSLWNPIANLEGRPIQASGSGVLKTRGVAPGDVLYIISLSEGQLFLGGRMVVTDIVSRHVACKLLGRDSLFETDRWAINMGGGSPLHLHRRLAPDVSKKLRFMRTNGERGLTFIDDNRLDNQATRGISRLTDESARLLDLIIDQTDSMPRTKDVLTVSTELIAMPISSAIKPSPLDTAESTTLSARIFEGLVNEITATVRERSQAARDGCIRTHGWNCAVCDVNFEKLYGPIGKEFIHVHHLEPLAACNEAREVNPTTDLIPLCPNCHAMVHRKEPPISISDLRTMIAEQGQRFS